MVKVFGFALLAGLVAQTAASLPNISVKGAKFFADGKQFFLKGVAYQGTPADPLVDTNQCQLDAKSMQSIGTNSIRVYHVDPYANHDGCMSAFSDAGIYIWLDLDTFNTTIVQTAPTWTEKQFAAFALVMDVFHQYDNIGGFWIGNEVINTAAGSSAAPYVKAATADIKAYMAAKRYRAIPIGYSAADIAEIRPMLQNYLACGDSQSQTIDFFGLNSYEWCGDATYQTSGYTNLQAMAEDYSIPIFFSETGCNVGGARTFQDQNAIFGPEMSGTWSGSIIYEWVEETNHYGLVKYPNGQIYSGAPVPMQPDFDNLSNIWKTLTAPNLQEAAYTPTLSAPACPQASAGWVVNGNVPLPTMAAGAFSAVVANSGVIPTQTSTTVKKSSLTTTSGTSTTPSSSSARAASAESEVSATSMGVPPPATSTAHSGASTSLSQILPSLLQEKFPLVDIYHIANTLFEPWAVNSLVVFTIVYVVVILMLTSIVICLIVLMYYHSPIEQGTFGDVADLGWGFQRDVSEGGIEYKGKMDEVDIVLQRVKERRERRVKGLPRGACLSSQGLEMHIIKRAGYAVADVGSDSEGEAFPLLD